MRYRGGLRGRPDGAAARAFRWSPAFINVAGLSALVLLTGGSSRPDVWSLLILRPAAVLSLGYGLWALTWSDINRHRFLFSMAAAIMALVVISLIPLPPALWTSFGGRDIIVAIDAATGLRGTWRPISMAPELTWNAMFSLAVPLAILINGVRLTNAEHRLTMLVMLAGGVLTMIAALGQIAGGGDPWLYPYLHSSFGEPSGLFSNRNHEALFLAALLPVIGVFFVRTGADGRSAKPAMFLIAVGTLVIVAFLLVLGSRAGLVAGAVGLLALTLSAFVARDRRASAKRTRWLMAAFGFASVAAILGAGIMLGNARSVQRFMTDDRREELRYQIWPVIADAVPSYMPFGTGIGTYERVFRIIEPNAILRPTYSNHAHNDWLEVAYTGGVPGIVLMIVAVVGFAVAAWRLRRVRIAGARLMAGAGLVIIFIAAIGSVIDYPLRTPILSVLFTLSCLWVASGLRAKHDEVGLPAGDQNMSQNWKRT